MNYEIKRNRNIQKKIEVELRLQRMGISIRVIGNSNEFALIWLIEFTNTLI